MRVLLVDADLRRPMVAETLGLENAVGLTTMLVGAVDFEEARLPLGRDVAVGAARRRSSAEPRRAARLGADVGGAAPRLRQQFDVMVVDTAPLLSVSDATIISQNVDTTIVVADVTKVRIAQLSRSLDALKSAGGQVAGILFSRVKRQRGDAYNYYYTSIGRETPTGGHPQTRRDRRARRAPRLRSDDRARRPFRRSSLTERPDDIMSRPLTRRSRPRIAVPHSPTRARVQASAAGPEASDDLRHSLLIPLGRVPVDGQPAGGLDPVLHLRPSLDDVGQRIGDGGSRVRCHPPRGADARGGITHPRHVADDDRPCGEDRPRRRCCRMTRPAARASPARRCRRGSSRSSGWNPCSVTRSPRPASAIMARSDSSYSS